MGDCRQRHGLPSRRQVIAGASASALALGTGSGFAQTATIASGTVFEDTRGTGRRRVDDRRLAGVLVSNGRDVVPTDAHGRWQLPVEPGDSVFVIKPPHWTTPHDANGLPRFSYLHQPEGSTGPARFPGVAPTGALPQSIDFSLVRREESTHFQAALVSDTQPENDTELGYLRDDIIAPLIGSDLAFAINHGDVVADDLALYPRYLELLGATGLDWHHCPGNHDLNLDAAEDALARETWKRVFGPRHYAFQHGLATFVLLDNIHYHGRHADGARYAGRIGQQQLQFVRNLLQHVPRDHLVVLSMHIPLVCHDAQASPGNSTADASALLALLSGRPHTVSFSGHMHTTEHHYLGVDASFARAAPHHHHVLTAACGSWWCGPRDGRGIPSADSIDGTPNGLHVLSVDGNTYATRFMPAASKGAAQMRVMICAPDGGRVGTIPADRAHECEIVANVFDGGPRTVVTCEIAGSGTGPVPMERVARRDPLATELLTRPDAVRKAWVEAVPSTHVWSMRVPGALRPGANRATIRATDEYGRHHVAHAILEISAPRHA
jgi:hypothetical protein